SIADHGSFSAAAAALHTVQSNVSSHVARLERELGAQLVDRHAGELTEEGHAVVERARRISAEMDAIAADVAALRHEITGTARVGIIGTTARWLAPLLIDRAAATHPGLRLLIGDGTSATLEPLLATGLLDAAVVNLPQTNPDLSARSLFDEELVLVVPSGHALAERTELELTDLDGLELLLPAPGSAFREELDEAVRSASIGLVPKAELDGMRLMVSLTLRGYGPAILPATGASESSEGVVRIPVHGLPRRRVGVVLRARGRPSAPARAMLELLDQVVEDNLCEGSGLHPPAARAS
ncbi:MAG: LysR family transcriptional regulator, partial [Acidimicrobiaceae bacterium]|nr:LysR family transcriptional regulator [Acidimicrobiaceae bacterium]